MQKPPTPADGNPILRQLNSHELAAMSRVASAESNNDPGRIGDNGHAIGLFQLDTRYDGFRSYLNQVPDEALIGTRIPSNRLAEIRLGSAPNDQEKQSLASFLSTTPGQESQYSWYLNDIAKPVRRELARHKAADMIEDGPTMALLHDQFIQRGETNFRNWIASKLPEGRFTATDLLNAEIAGISHRKDEGAAIILHRRIKLAQELGIKYDTNMARTLANQLVSSLPGKTRGFTHASRAAARLQMTQEQAHDVYTEALQGVYGDDDDDS